MRLAIVGTGYVGLTVGATCAEMGHTVRCVDIDTRKIQALRHGQVEQYEPGLEDMVRRNVGAKRLSFTADLPQAIRFAEVVFSAVGTPPDKDHNADLTAVEAVAAAFGEHANEHKLFVNKSTVPVGTGERCKRIILKAFANRGSAFSYDQVSNPEFLREGCAVTDCLKPDRIVVGAESARAVETMRRLYAPIVEKGATFFACSIPSAELIKYAANAFLATKISFMNEIARVCELVGADILDVERGVGLDSRIGRRFLHAGIGYGGSCFPKDVDALIATGKNHGYDFEIISAARRVNSGQKMIAYTKLSQALGDLRGKKIAVWGLSFKPKTDDMREAPSVMIIRRLLADGAQVTAYDPAAADNARRAYFPELAYGTTALEAARGADALLLLTEWDEFRSIDFSELKRSMRGSVIIDGRNIWLPSDVRAHGLTYYGIGRA